jgi:hypothetical protein
VPVFGTLATGLGATGGEAGAEVTAAFEELARGRSQGKIVVYVS